MPRSTPAAGLRLREYVGYALGDTASNLFFQTFNIFLIYYYVDVWGLAAASVGTMMIVVRLFDAVNDPVMGLICDRTRTRWGKYRPYLLIMAVPYGVCGYLVFANPDLSDGGKLVYAYATYTAMLVAYTAINVPYCAMLGVISPSSRTRSVASSFRFVGAFTGGFLITLFVRPLVAELGGGDDVQGFQYTMAIFAVASIVLFGLTFVWTKERVEPPANQRTNVREELGELGRNRPWVILLFAAVFSTTFIILRAGSTLFYFKYVVGDDGTPILLNRLDASTVFLSSGMLCQILGTATFGFFARLADKRRSAIALTMVTAVAYGLFFILPADNFPLLLLMNGIGAFAMGPTSALVWAMYADVADYGEWKFGRRSTALVYSASLFSLKTGSMIAGWLTPLFLASFGFVRDAEQTPRAILGITLAFSLGPFVFATLKALAIWIYPLNQKEVDRIEQELAARRAAPAPTAT